MGILSKKHSQIGVMVKIISKACWNFKLLIILFSLFISNKSFSCVQDVLDLNGKEVTIRKRLEFWTKNSSLILVIQPKSISGDMVNYNIIENLRGFYPGKKIGFDYFPFIEDVDHKNKLRDLEFRAPRVSRASDCTPDRSSLNVLKDRYYLYFAGGSEYTLEKITYPKMHYWMK